MSKAILFLIIFLLLATATGFYLILDNLNELNTEMKNMRLVFQIAKNDAFEQSDLENGKEKEVSTEDVPVPIPEIKSINTSIVFSLESSPLLRPVTDLVFHVEKVFFNPQGLLQVQIRVWNNESSTYSATEPEEIFEIVRFESSNLNVKKTEGPFSSIPPGGEIRGAIIFSLPEKSSTFILQIKTKNDLRFYEFNFENLSYKEVVLG